MRGLGLSVNQAVHIQGCNDFLLQQAAVLPVRDSDVAPTGARKKRAGAEANPSDAHMSSESGPGPGPMHQVLHLLVTKHTAGQHASVTCALLLG